MHQELVSVHHGHVQVEKYDIGKKSADIEIIEGHLTVYSSIANQGRINGADGVFKNSLVVFIIIDQKYIAYHFKHIEKGDYHFFPTNMPFDSGQIKSRSGG